MIDRINAMLDALEACEFVLDEDVAWVAVSSDDIQSIPGTIFHCPVRFVDCVKYRDVEFRVSQWARNDYRPYPAWNMTKRTKDMTYKPGSPQSKFKQMEW